jgi:uncharacterized protein (DUF2126 family)
VYTARPANAAEARARRLARFVVSAPPAEVLAVPVAETNVVYPMTLDMRWPWAGDVAGVSSGISADGAI